MRPLLQKWVWFVGLWILGVSVVGAVAYIIRLFLMP